MQATDQRIRQVAIVLQSLDAGTAKSLLGQLPPDVARQVKLAMVKLGPVSAAERAEAMSGLQGLFGPASKKSTSVPQRADSPAAAILAEHRAIDELDWSSEHRSGSYASSSSIGPPESELPWLAWEPSALATFLANERPTVIATVLNQLSAERAKLLLDHLPVDTAGATLAAIPSLFLADPSILSDILAEVERKLPKQPPVQTTATIAGIAKLAAIIDQFQGVQRQAWLKSIAAQNRDVALQLGWEPDQHYLPNSSLAPIPSASASQSLSSESAASPTGSPIPSSSPLSSAPIASIGRPDSQTTAGTSAFASTTTAGINHDAPTILPIHLYQNERSNKKVQEPVAAPAIAAGSRESQKVFDDLIALSDGDMVTLLHACNRVEVLQSIRHCSKPMLERIESLIPTGDLKKFREFYKQFQSITVQDSETAQQSILATAERMMATGKIGSLQSFSYLAAA